MAIVFKSGRHSLSNASKRLALASCVTQRVTSIVLPKLSAIELAIPAWPPFRL